MYQSRAKHDVSPPWPSQRCESGYFLAEQGLTDPARPIDKLRPYGYPVSPDWPCHYLAGWVLIGRAQHYPVGGVLPRGPRGNYPTLITPRIHYRIVVLRKASFRTGTFNQFGQSEQGPQYSTRIRLKNKMPFVLINE